MHNFDFIYRILMFFPISFDVCYLFCVLRGTATTVPEFPSKLDWLNTAPLQLQRVNPCLLLYLVCCLVVVSVDLITSVKQKMCHDL